MEQPLILPLDSPGVTLELAGSKGASLNRLIPRLMLSDGQAFYEGVAAPEEVGEGVLVGTPVSPGVAEGAIRVIPDPHGATLAPEEVLVCRSTDPPGRRFSWSPAGS